VISQQLIEMFIQLRIKLQKTINEAASRLSMTSKVLARIDELQARVAGIAEKKLEITHTEILNHLNILRNSN
jgi:hypothetical protein